MKMILTAGALCVALLFAAVSAVNAKSVPANDTVTPPTLVGE